MQALLTPASEVTQKCVYALLCSPNERRANPTIGRVYPSDIRNLTTPRLFIQRPVRVSVLQLSQYLPDIQPESTTAVPPP